MLRKRFTWVVVVAIAAFVALGVAGAMHYVGSKESAESALEHDMPVPGEEEDGDGGESQALQRLDSDS